jgi:quinol monooxygenase YgiN
MILIAVRHPVRPELADDWPTHVEALTNGTRDEAGCLFFEWYRSADDPNCWLLLEGFRDGDAGAAHVASDHFKATIERMPSMLSAAPEIINIEVPGNEWSSMAELAPS